MLYILKSGSNRETPKNSLKGNPCSVLVPYQGPLMSANPIGGRPLRADLPSGVDSTAVSLVSRVTFAVKVIAFVNRWTVTLVRKIGTAFVIVLVPVSTV